MQRAFGDGWWAGSLDKVLPLEDTEGAHQHDHTVQKQLEARRRAGRHPWGFINLVVAWQPIRPPQPRQLRLWADRKVAPGEHEILVWLGSDLNWQPEPVLLTVTAAASRESRLAIGAGNEAASRELQPIGRLTDLESDLPVREGSARDVFDRLAAGRELLTSERLDAVLNAHEGADEELRSLRKLLIALLQTGGTALKRFLEQLTIAQGSAAPSETTFTFAQFETACTALI
eukprot:SAG11_NODE_227_length_11995_cov_4.386601_3_plen_231_part_00